MHAPIFASGIRRQ
ncbi:d295eb6a-1b02-4ed4-887f-2d0f967903d8 [Thermothielavioides terrestris]|uniref:D295eb6a-1b02-4ed4-887f-2d0f967903d8 n=1 Tax=Thermothielavioides terrestris TaxID=2587410 RepID=A0A3S4ESN1_9PEZI|nr:d295eb6a-1b02-4ed4-887f-2d0f967903d8 [Thermothielavioides terrestris]